METPVGSSVVAEPRSPWYRSPVLWIALPLAFLWFRLINNLQVEWSTNDQYGYGWIVPILCLSMLFTRGFAPRNMLNYTAGDASSPLFGKTALCFGALLALSYFPVRLIEGATPEWRPIQWALAFQTIGLTLLAIYLVAGPSTLKRYAFPIAFFLVAVPWPSAVETPIIQFLTQVHAKIAVEVLGWLGYPALQHGSVIEVGTGVLGVDEACSGIRSFQSSLMISLFIGEYLRLGTALRIFFVPLGFLVASIYNSARMTFLAYVAARDGVKAVDTYHDSAGFLILIACAVTMWLIGYAFKRFSNSPPASVNSELGTRPLVVNHGSFSGELTRGGVGNANSEPRGFARAALHAGLALLIWLVVAESAVWGWYRSREAKLVASTDWELAFPTNNPSFQTVPLTDNEKNLLRYDQGEHGRWIEPDGLRWQGYYFNWVPGRVAGYLAKRHTPDVCLPAVGLKQRSGPELMVVEANGVKLPVRYYTFASQDGQRLLHVFHARWEGGATADTFTVDESSRFNLVRAVWAGRGNHGQKVIGFVASGTDDPAVAKAAFIAQMQQLIRPKT